MKNISLVAIAVAWCDAIKNGRTIRTALDSIRDETDEIEEEIVKVELGRQPGSDGIFGEAVDVIASALDVIRMERPNSTVEELEIEVAAYLDKKCEKWAKKYA